jgi:hypothetical protein
MYQCVNLSMSHYDPYVNLLIESYPSPILPVKPTVVILDSPPKSDPKSIGHDDAATVFLPFLSLNHFALFSGCNFQQW